MLRGQGEGSGGGRRPKKEELVFPFNVAECETVCPNGHSVELSTGYSSSAPDWWKQWGNCPVCHRCVERMVGMRFRDGEYRFLAGPIHWYGEKTKEEEDWIHDVLEEHCCERCHLLAKKELAEALLAKVRAKDELFRRTDLTEADMEIVSLLEELVEELVVQGSS